PPRRSSPPIAPPCTTSLHACHRRAPPDSCTGRSSQFSCPTPVLSILEVSRPAPTRIWLTWEVSCLERKTNSTTGRVFCSSHPLSGGRRPKPIRHITSSDRCACQPLLPPSTTATRRRKIDSTAPRLLPGTRPEGVEKSENRPFGSKRLHGSTCA